MDRTDDTAGQAGRKQSAEPAVCGEYTAKKTVGRICFSPIIPLLLLLASVAAILLLLPPVQAVLVAFGRGLVGRKLTQEVWWLRFSAWGKDILSCTIPALLTYAALSTAVKMRSTRVFEWTTPFKALALWGFLHVCAIPAERRRHLLVVLAAVAICLLIHMFPKAFKAAARKGGKSNTRAKSAAVPKKLPILQILWIAAPALLALCLGLIFIDRGHTWGSDFAEYITQAQVLATGQDNPARAQVGYKYGTALLLLPFLKTRNLDFLFLKIPMLLCFTAFIVCASLFYRTRLAPRTAFAASCILAVSPALVTFLNNILSDIPFLFFSSLSVILACALYSVEAKESAKNGRGGGTAHGKAGAAAIAAAAGLCCAAAYFCRFQGLVLLLAFASCDCLILFRALCRPCRKRRLLLYWTQKLPHRCPSTHLAFYAAFAAAHILYTLLLPSSPRRSDLGFLADFSIAGLAKNLFAYPFFFSGFFSCNGHCPRAISLAFYLAFLPLTAAGLARKAGEEPLPFIYSLGLLVLSIIWPGPRDFRFLFPILPFMVLFAAYGFESLSDRSLKRCYASLSLLAICIFLCSMLAEEAGNIGRGRSGDYQATSRQAEEAYRFIREHVGTEERILFFKPRVLYLMTGRISGEYEKTTEGFCRQLAEYDYILHFTGQTPAMPLPPGKITPEKLAAPLEEAFTNGSFTLYRINHHAQDLQPLSRQEPESGGSQ